MTHAPLLTTHRLVMIRTALVEFLAERERRERILHQYAQGQHAVHGMLAIGNELKDARGLLDDVNARIAEATGVPQIQRHNEGIAWDSPAWPLSPADEAREANARG